MTVTSATSSGPSLTALSGGASDTSRLKTRANLDQAGEQFEAIFVQMMLKSMRNAKLADGLFDSKALDQFRDMQDQQLAKSMAHSTPIGIGKAMTEFLAKSDPTKLAPASSAALPTGPLSGDSE